LRRNANANIVWNTGISRPALNVAIYYSLTAARDFNNNYFQTFQEFRGQNFKSEMFSHSGYIDFMESSDEKYRRKWKNNTQP
jgi:hypothetical protein